MIDHVCTEDVTASIQRRFRSETRTFCVGHAGCPHDLFILKLFYCIIYLAYMTFTSRQAISAERQKHDSEDIVNTIGRQIGIWAY